MMQALGERKGELVNMEPDGRGRVRLGNRIRRGGLIGFPTNSSTSPRAARASSPTSSTATSRTRANIGGRKNGVLISMDGERDLHLRAGQAGRSRPHVRQGRRPGVRRA